MEETKVGSEEAGIKDGYPVKPYSEDSLTREQEYRTFCWGLSEQDQVTKVVGRDQRGKCVGAGIKGGLPTETHL